MWYELSMVDTEQDTTEHKKQSSLTETLKDVTLGAFVGAIGTEVWVWPQVSRHLQNYWQKADQYHFEQFDNSLRACKNFAKSGDEFLANIEAQNAESHKKACEKAGEMRDALRYGPVKPAHYAIIAGSVVAIAALTIGIKRLWDSQHQENPSAVIQADSAEHTLPEALRAVGTTHYKE
jgi:hypothetical protein